MEFKEVIVFLATNGHFIIIYISSLDMSIHESHTGELSMDDLLVLVQESSLPSLRCFCSWPREIIKQPLLTETDHDDSCLTSSMGFGDLYIPWYQNDLKVRAKSFGQEKNAGLPKKC